MKRMFLLILLLVIITSAANTQSTVKLRDGKLLRGEKWIKFTYPATADFYVSTRGNDEWSGTVPDPDSAGKDGPFRTIERAMKAVRELKSKVYFPKDPPVEKRWIGSPHPLGRGKDILVYIREGIYYLSGTLVFGPDDGGERVETNLPTGAFEYHKLKDHYVTYAAYPGEKPVISGERQVTGWRKEGKFLAAPYNADTAAMLIVNGTMQTLARTPNQGYFIPPAISSSTSEILFRKGEIKNWKEMEGNRIIMLLRWHTGVNSIVSADEKSGVALLRSPQEGVVIVPPRYYIENVKALLDTAGEWYFDKIQKKIFVLPSYDRANIEEMRAGVPVLDQLLHIEGTAGKPVRNLRICGLTFEGVTAGNSAITMRWAHASELEDNEIRACGGTGVTVSEGCYQAKIINNTFRTIDNGGVYALGPSRPMDGRQIIRETEISYNKFFNCGGNNIYSSYTLLTTIAHNYITMTRGRYGIDIGGWANQEEAIDGCYTVEYNHLDNVQLGADDSGAIKTAGMTFNSVVRGNLIHKVNAGFFNDNVAFWFDNMSSGWTSEENIYYDLEQGEMKLCAALPEDNCYRNNFTIERPSSPPEMIIDGLPVFTADNLTVEGTATDSDGAIEAGSFIRVSADIFNSGSSGIDDVILYVDGKIFQSVKHPVIRNNSRRIDFGIRLYDEGEHTIAIGSTGYRKIRIKGEKTAVVFEDFRVSQTSMLQGEPVIAGAVARNLTSEDRKIDVILYVDDKAAETRTEELKANETRIISFVAAPGPGAHRLRIGNSSEKNISVFESVPLDLSKLQVSEYCSAKAKPYSITRDASNGKITISAGGSDFYHAEDSYAAAYVKGISGDFVATVTISRFGERTHEWFRSGLFVRNDISKSFDVLPGSKGSVLVFGTPGRAGIEYDEFANGCMHKASSQNLPENSRTPVYLKLVRHGNSFSAYISLDGRNWIIERHTTDIPGIAGSVDLGLAAGGPDKRVYTVEFSDWKIQVQKPGSNR